MISNLRYVLLAVLALTGICSYSQAPAISNSSPQTYETGTAIAALTPTASGVAAPSYSASPVLVGPAFSIPTGVAVDAADNVSDQAFTTVTTKIPDGSGSPVNVLRDNAFTAPSGARTVAGQSSVATLSALTISSGALSPAFASGTTSYTASVSNAATTITVTPTTSDANATVTVDGTAVTSGMASGAINLNVGQNTITTVVTAQDGTTTKTYTITVTRLKSSNAVLSYLQLSSGTLSPAFNYLTKSYTASVSNSTSTITVTPRAADATATITVNGVAAASNTASGPINLAVGPNTITMIVTAQNGTTTDTYTVTVTRLSSPSLSALTISSGTLSPAFASGITGYTASVSNATTSITVTPTTSDANATITVDGTAVTSGTTSGAINLSVGQNAITTVVTAQDGVTTTTYTVTVTRLKSSNAALSDLQLSSGTLSPAFSYLTKSYTASVSNATASITVTPRAADATATITVNGVAVASNTASGLINLAVGQNTITTIVTAQNGVTTDTYILTVTRAPSSVATLSALTTSSGTWEPPGFVGNREGGAYTVSVAKTVTSITVTATTTDPTATITERLNSTTIIPATSGVASNAVPLATGQNYVIIYVTAQDGVTTNSYDLTINRAGTSNAALSYLQLSSGTLSPSFSYLTKSYTASVSNATAAITVTPRAADTTATITVNGVAVASNTASGPINLAFGPNTITTVVTAPNGVTTDTYTVTVTRRPALSGLTISSGFLSPAFASGTLDYSAYETSATNSITITPTTADPNATVTVNGVAVASGTPSQPQSVFWDNINIVDVVVTAPDGKTTTTYEVALSAPNADRGYLVWLQISSGTLTPAFNYSYSQGSGKSFAASVSNATTSITVTPTAADGTTTIFVNGIVVASGAASGPIALAVGANNITIEGYDSDTESAIYKLTVTRAPSGNAGLSNLVSSGGALTPTFAAGTTSYTESVSNTTASISITPTTSDTTAKVTVNGTAVTSGTPSSAIPLNVGQNTITTMVTAQDDTTTDTYTLTVTRAAPGDNNVYQPVSVAKPDDSPAFDDEVVVVHPAVSPNGDGINDFLMIDGILAYPDNHLMIMNRSGMLVYDTKGYDNSTRIFDGHSNKTGQMQLPGTYFYSLDYTVKGIIKHKAGFLVLKY